MVIYPGKWIFLATPHTGSTAVRYALEHGPMKDNVIPNRNYAPKQSFRGYHHWGMEDETKNPEKRTEGNEVTWSVHRNPYDLAATWFVRYAKQFRHEGEEHPPDFPEFLRRFSKLPLVVGGEIFWHNPDVWLRYDNLQAEINKFLVEHDSPEVVLDVKGPTSKKKPWHTYYDETPEAFEVMNERFGDEIEKFGYEILTPA